MQPIYIYMLTYILPAFLLITLATYVILHNNRAVENRLIFVLLMVFCVTLGGEFLRHVSPFSYNPPIAVYVVGFSTSISMAIVFHLQFILIKQHCPLTIHPFVPFLGYLFVPLHAIITLFFAQLSVADFYQVGIWIYRENWLYNLWLYGIVGMTSITSFFACLYGWKNSTTIHGKKLMRFLSIGTTVILLAFFIMIVVLKIDTLIPNPTIFLIFVTGILLVLGITKFEMTPSIQARYQTMFDLTPTSIMLLNERLEVLEMNHRAKSFFYHSEDGKLKSFLHTTANIRQGLRFIKKLRHEKTLHNFQADFLHPVTNKKITLLIEAILLPFQNKNQYYIMWQDITHEVEQEKLIHHLAFHDVLTGIQNRAYFVNNLTKTLQTHAHERHALVLIDLNYFKQINDSYGHLTGDAVLQFVATQLQLLVEKEDTVARLGGDEFVILFKNIEHLDQIELSMQKIRDYFEKNPFHYYHFNQSISLSMGYSLFPQDGSDFEVLFNIADLNMYKDKSRIKTLKH